MRVKTARDAVALSAVGFSIDRIGIRPYGRPTDLPVLRSRGFGLSRYAGRYDGRFHRGPRLLRPFEQEGLDAQIPPTSCDEQEDEHDAGEKNTGDRAQCLTGIRCWRHGSCWFENILRLAGAGWHRRMIELRLGRSRIIACLLGLTCFPRAIICASATNPRPALLHELHCEDRFPPNGVRSNRQRKRTGGENGNGRPTLKHDD